MSVKVTDVDYLDIEIIPICDTTSYITGVKIVESLLTNNPEPMTKISKTHIIECPERPSMKKARLELVGIYVHGKMDKYFDYVDVYLIRSNIDDQIRMDFGRDPD